MQVFVDYITMKEHYNHTHTDRQEHDSMNRYDTAEWKELVSIQNAMVTPIDILTITGFMNHEQFIQHLEYYRVYAK